MQQLLSAKGGIPLEAGPLERDLTVCPFGIEHTF